MSSICKVNFTNTKTYFNAIVNLLHIVYAHRTSHIIFSVPTSQLVSRQTLNKSSPGKLHPHSFLRFLLLSRTWCGRSLWSVCPSCILSQALIHPQQASDQQRCGFMAAVGLLVEGGCPMRLGHGGLRKGTLPWPGAKGLQLQPWPQGPAASYPAPPPPTQPLLLCEDGGKVLRACRSLCSPKASGWLCCWLAVFI